MARPEIAQKGGAQLFYTDIGQWVPWTQTGAPLVIQRQAGGQGQPLSYTDAGYREVSALPGAPLLESNERIARPEIPMKGGFSPSIMTNLVGNAAYLTPLAMTAAYRLWSNKQTRKQRGGNGEEWEAYKQQAKGMLQGVAPGKANAKWINKLAKILKEKKNTAAALEEFADLKGVEPKVKPRFATKLNEWEYDQRQAKKELGKYGVPTAAEVTHLAALKTGRKGKEGDAPKFVDEFRQRQQAKKNAAVNQEEKRIQKQIQAAEKAAAVPVKKVKVEKPKLVFNERPWETIRKEAKDELLGFKKVMKRGNVMRYASMKRLKNTDRQQKFLDEFRARADTKANDANESTSESNEEFRVNLIDHGKKKRRRTMKKGREEWESYQSGARRMLERIGPATIAEISALAKMMKQGENIRPFVNEFEQRVQATEVREAGLERERNEREAVVAVVGSPSPPPKPVNALPPPPPKPADALPPPPKPADALPPPPKPAAVAKANPLHPVDQAKFAQFRKRLEELAKKYPGPK